MLDSYLNRNDVKSFIKEIKTNERYFQKTSRAVMPNLFNSYEAALYIFYDALFKYKIIVNDVCLFDEYIEQLEKLYKKLDNFDDIRFGINKLICKIVIIKSNIKDIDNEENRDLILQHIYNRYIKEGYYIHGFSSTYIDDIKSNGFIPEKYENYYDRFKNINKVFAKNNVIHIINKDFKDNKVFFTDDFVYGCYYSSYSPLYFSKFLMNEEYFGTIKRKDSYLKDRYSMLIGPLKRFMSNNLFSESDKKEILDLVDDEWNLLHRKDRCISLLLVKRKSIGKNDFSLNEYFDDDTDIYEMVDRLLNSKSNNISYDENISKEDISILVLDNYYDKEEEKVENDENESNVNIEFINKYGSVSYLLLFGSLFITLGVIFTLVKVIGG